MTKAEEIKLYRDFVENLPRDSYLSAILRGSDNYVEQQIRNDFALPMAGELRELQTQAAQAAKEVAALQQKIAEMKKMQRDLTQQIEAAQAGMQSIKTVAQRILRFA